MILEFIKNFFCTNKKPIVNSKKKEEEERPPIRKKYLKVRDGKNGDYYTLEEFNKLVEIIRNIDTTSLFVKQLRLEVPRNTYKDDGESYYTLGNVQMPEHYEHENSTINRIIEQLKLDDLKKILNMRFETCATQEKDAFELMEVEGCYSMRNCRYNFAFVFYPHDPHDALSYSSYKNLKLKSSVFFNLYLSDYSSSCEMQRCNYDLQYIEMTVQKYYNVWSIYNCTDNIIKFSMNTRKGSFDCNINYDAITKNIALGSVNRMRLGSFDSIQSVFFAMLFEKRITGKIPYYSSRLGEIKFNPMECRLNREIVNEEINAFLHSMS